MPLTSISFQLLRGLKSIRATNVIAVSGSNPAQDESVAFPPVSQAAPFDVSKSAEALVAAG